jgi:RNA polymerase sigma factor (sigma-70 family)
MRDTHAENYMLGTGSVPLMGPDEELRRATAIGELRRRVWQGILRHAEGPRATLAALRHIDPDAAKKWSGRLLRLQRQTQRSARAVSTLVADLSNHDLDLELCGRVLPELGPPATTTAIRDAHRRFFAEKHHFVLANLGLVFKVAGRYRRTPLGFHDLVQEGVLGLMRAIDMFDPERGFRFSTYAVWWIRHAIGRAIADRSRTIRVPVHIIALQSKMKRETERLRDSLGRPPTQKELARACNVTLERVSLAQDAQALSLVSLDQPLRPDAEPLDLPTEDPTDSLHMHLAADGLDELLDNLDAMEADVVRKRFGLHHDPMTLQEIGDEYALSRERIRQIELKAIGKLRDALEASAPPS